MASSRRVQNFSDDLKNVEFETSEEVEVTPTFDGLGLREDLLRGIYAYGKYTTLRYPFEIWPDVLATSHCCISLCFTFHRPSV